jgi:hypothetical protein
MLRVRLSASLQMVPRRRATRRIAWASVRECHSKCACASARRSTIEKCTSKGERASSGR